MGTKTLKLIILLVLFAAHANTQDYIIGNPEPQGSRDAFGKWRVSTPTNLFDAQFNFDRQPLLFDTITVESGTSISYDGTNRCVDLSMSSTPTGGIVAMQSFEFIPYQPGKSQNIHISFNMQGGTTDVTKFAGLSDGDNGIEFILNGATPAVRILSLTDEGNQTVNQSSWNLDPLDGTGLSGLTLHTDSSQILVIDFQALYAGRVRIGFNIGGKTIYVHEFNHANGTLKPYIQTANLPIRVGMSSSATVSSDMTFICCSVTSEGGSQETYSVPFSTYTTVTAANGSDTHVISIEPDSLFKGFVNRVNFELESIDIAVTGSNPVVWKLCIGQDLTAKVVSDVNTTYSAMNKVTGTLSGTPVIVIAQGNIPSTSQAKTNINRKATSRLPITLDHEGNKRVLGRLTVLVQGVGGTSATNVALNWKEIR